MRSWILLIVLSAMLALTAACSSDDDAVEETPTPEDTATEVESTPTPEPEPTPTETPEPEPTATPEPEPTETPVPTPEPEETETDDEGEETADRDGRAAGQNGSELDGLLISIDDLPEGWFEVDDSAVETDDIADVSDDPFDAPCGIEGLEDEIEPIAEGERTFEGSELGPYLSQNLMQLESSEDAEDVMNLMRELFGCEEWTETDEFGDEVTFTIEEVPFDGVGDDSFALLLGLSFDDLSEEEAAMMALFGDFNFDIVIFRRDEYISMILYFDLFGMSETDLESVVQLADEKIQSGG